MKKMLVERSHLISLLIVATIPASGNGCPQRYMVVSGQILVSVPLRIHNHAYLRNHATMKHQL